MKILKVKFTGSFDYLFRDVEFRFNYGSDRYEGDIKKQNSQIYIKNIRIPIRETLTSSAYNEFVMLANNQAKYSSIYFIIDANGGYLVKRKCYNNRISMFLDTISGVERSWNKPCFGDKPNFSY